MGASSRQFDSILGRGDVGMKVQIEAAQIRQLADTPETALKMWLNIQYVAHATITALFVNLLF
jgi:hypothetical protein